ncbi:hypothetical protein BJX61DRAFT_546732 [Aspergillus egyptiacus]|nr:hypothetical protein BJX61DRAFT_546732 [Aspergillus egyptiacus]
MADWIPDIVVGVDFGMTCTGVAYSHGPTWPTPKPIQHWPGLLGSQIATKVPSHILYLSSPSPTTPNIKWGFQCEDSLNTGTADPAHGTKSIKQFFKLNLDPSFSDSRPNAPTHDDAMRYFQDYIKCLYGYLTSYFEKSLPRFGDRRVEFVFSVPTTWKDPRMVEGLRRAIGSCLYNSQTKGVHKAVIGLTEAEAAAVYVSGLHYQKNDVILVCDAGGGTTDVNVLKLVSDPGAPTVYHPLGYVEGKPIGSVFIDLGVHALLCTKLSPISASLPGSLEDVAWSMMNGRFERFKCSFGVEGGALLSLQLDLPASVVDPHSPECGIHNGKVDEIRHIFDQKINDLFDLLDEQIRRLAVNHPAEKISFLVLSGGFGSCPYVRNRLTARYASQTGMQVLTVDEPQLAVVQGQVLNRIQQLKSGSTMFNHLYSPVSYGVICDWLYDPKQHAGEPTRFDERNQKTYAINQIDWIVFQVPLLLILLHSSFPPARSRSPQPRRFHQCTRGDLIPRTGISKSFPRKIYPRDLSKPFTAQIVMSTLPRPQLPRSMSQAGAKLICELEVDTSRIDKKPKNHRWYHRAPVYFLVTVVVKFVMEGGGLGFELWSAGAEKGGVRIGGFSATNANAYANSHLMGARAPDEPIRIRWEAMAEKMQDEGRGMVYSPARLSVPLSSTLSTVSGERESVVSEVRGDSVVRFELAGDMEPVQRGREVKHQSYFA